MIKITTAEEAKKMSEYKLEACMNDLYNRIKITINDHSASNMVKMMCPTDEILKEIEKRYKALGYAVYTSCGIITVQW
jgi:hypothetical protein